MKISLKLLPIILFFLSYGLIQVSFSSLKYLQETEDEKEIQALEEIVIDRFQRYLELPHMVSILGAEYLAHGGIKDADYEKYAVVIQQNNPEILGFNIVDENGVIIRTFPKSQNTQAQGKVTQMFELLKESKEKNEPFMFSPPFRLFQGVQGFVLYQPIIIKEMIKGWYAVVISSDAFLQDFRAEDFLNIFDLVIVDEKTGLDYFATSIEPQKGTKVYSRSKDLYGRRILFKTWRKIPDLIHTFPWYFSVAMSLILAGAFWFILRLYDQRKKASSQLQNISILLRVTSKEALSNLIEIHSEFNRLNLPEGEQVDRLSRDINYLSNLIEQIDLLQTMAHSREGLESNECGFMNILERQLDIFSDVIDRKHIRVSVEKNEFEFVVLKTNEWLFENSVLSNVLSHLLIHIESNTELKIENQSKGQWQIVAFRIKRHQGGEQSKLIVNRRLEVARKVLQLQRGELKEEYYPDEFVIKILLPL